jgi:cytoskeletal protein RodZ
VLEQQLTERFRAVVADEPPFALDPGELVDRLLRRRRRRLGLATALGVVVVATIAVGGATVGASTGQRAADPPPAPAVAPTDVRIAATVPSGSHDVVAEQRKQESVRSVSDFAVDAVPTDLGTLEIMRDGDVLFQADLARLDAYVFRPAEPVLLKPGQRVLIAVTCVRTASRAGACQVDVTFPVLVVAR